MEVDLPKRVNRKRCRRTLSGMVVKVPPGHCAHASSLRRALLSCFNMCYVYVRQIGRAQAMPCGGAVRREFRLSWALLRGCRRDLASRVSEWVMACGMSGWGLVFVEARHALEAIAEEVRYADGWRFLAVAPAPLETAQEQIALASGDNCVAPRDALLPEGGLGKSPDRQ